LFGERTAAIPITANKSMLGHTLGAAGAIEAAFCWIALARSEAGVLALPPHCWDGEQDPELPVLHLVRKGETAALRSAPRVMSNSFGFGGNNCTLVLGRDA
jgi:3-oxoacyl-[acyl-carrier-protein] synthase-1